MPKTSELTEITTLTDDDAILMVDAMASTRVSGWITALNAQAYFGSNADSEDNSYVDLGNQTGTTLTVNYATARTQRLVLANASNLVISFSNWPASGNRGSIELFFVHDNTTNTRTFSFSPTPKYHQGSAPSWPTATANAISRALVTTIDGGTTIFVDQIGADYA